MSYINGGWQYCGLMFRETTVLNPEFCKKWFLNKTQIKISYSVSISYQCSKTEISRQYSICSGIQNI